MSELEISDDPLDDSHRFVDHPVEAVVRVGTRAGGADRRLQEVVDAQTGFGRFRQTGNR